MELVTIVVVLVLGYLLYRSTRRDSARKKYDKIKGDPTVPFFGHTFNMGSTSAEIFTYMVKTWEKYGRGTYRLELGPNVFVVLSTPKEFEAILSTTQYLDKHDDYGFLVPWLGTGLLISTGSKWHSRRKLITPAFHFKILEPYVEVFQRGAQKLVDQLAAKDENCDVDVHPYMSICSLGSICETAMGINLDSDDGTTTPYAKAIEDMCRVLHMRIFGFFKRFDFIFNLTEDGTTFKKSLDIIHRKTDAVIAAKKLELKDKIEAVMSGSSDINLDSDADIGVKKRLAFMDLLLLSKTADGKPLSDEGIREEVNTFMFEGHDTTTSCLSFTMLCLARNPEVQEKIYQEQLEVCGGDLSRPASFQEVQNMKYLDRVIKESLRMYPAVPLFGRTITSDFTLPDGTELPKGTLITMAPMLTGKNPDLYPEPERFNPERFNSESGRNPYAYVPFSAGPRNCIGQKFAMLELKCVLSAVVRGLHVLPSPGFEPKLAAEITLKSENGIQVRLKKRAL